MRALFALLLVPGAGAGTAVGNPTGLTIDTATGPGVTLSAAVADVEVVLVTDRKGNTSTLEVDGPFDLLGGTRVEVPLADAARVRVVFSGPLEIEGVGPDGAELELSLEVPAVEVTLVAPTGEVSNAVLRLGEPGWISATRLGLDDGDVSVEEGDPLHGTLVDALTAGAAIYRDLDGDGRCDPDEDDDDDDDDDGECDGTPLGAFAGR